MVQPQRGMMSASLSKPSFLQPLVIALAMNILSASGFPGSGSNYTTAKLLVNLREFAQVTKAS